MNITFFRMEEAAYLKGSRATPVLNSILIFHWKYFVPLQENALQIV